MNNYNSEMYITTSFKNCFTIKYILVILIYTYVY